MIKQDPTQCIHHRVGETQGKARKGKTHAAIPKRAVANEKVCDEENQPRTASTRQSDEHDFEKT